MAFSLRVREHPLANLQRPFSIRPTTASWITSAAQYGIGDVAHTGLDGQERRRNAAGFHLGSQKVGYVLTDAHRYFVQRRERGYSVGNVCLDDAHDLGRIDLERRNTDAVGRLVDGNFPAVRRIGRFVQVVDAAQRFGVVAVEFDDDLFGQTGVRRAVAYSGGEGDFAFRGYVAGFDDGYVDVAQESIADVLCQLGEVVVEISGFPFVQGGTQVVVRLVGRTELDGMGAGEGSVQVVGGRGTGKYAYLEGTSCLVFFLGSFSQRFRNDLGASCSGKSAETDVGAVLDELCGIFGRNEFVRHLFETVL